MKRRAFIAAACAAALCTATPARARSVTTRVVKRLKLKFTTKAPTFASQRYGELMDRGRLFYLGAGIWHEQNTFYLLRLKDRKKITVRAPIQRFLLANRRTFPRAGTGGRMPAYKARRLLFYDRAQQVAGILLVDQIYKQHTIYYYLHWDLKQGRITSATRISSIQRNHSWISVRPIGYAPKRRELYLHVVKKQNAARGAARPMEVSVIAVGKGTLRVVASFLGARRYSRGPFHDPAHQRAFLVEYAERGETPAPQGFLVDLVGGKVTRISVPVVTYGVAFPADGKHLFAYSAQSGDVWKIDTRTGRRIAKTRVGGLGHEAGMITPDTLLVVRNQALHFLDPKRLRQWKQIPVKRFHQGFMHVQGTLVAPGWVFLRCSDDLYAIQVKLGK
ncbi:MAG: hypothetical protein ABI333_03785 [bacterium]